MDAFLTSRLVLYPGMNYFGWSLEKALEYMRDTRGLIKLVADADSKRLLGAHILAPEGADSIQTATTDLKLDEPGSLPRPVLIGQLVTWNPHGSHGAAFEVRLLTGSLRTRAYCG